MPWALGPLLPSFGPRAFAFPFLHLGPGPQGPSLSFIWALGRIAQIKEVRTLGVLWRGILEALNSTGWFAEMHPSSGACPHIMRLLLSTKHLFQVSLDVNGLYSVIHVACGFVAADGQLV